MIELKKKTINYIIMFTLGCFVIDFIVKCYLLKHTLWNSYIFIGILIDTIGKSFLAIVPLLLKHRR